MQYKYFFRILSRDLIIYKKAIKYTFNWRIYTKVNEKLFEIIQKEINYKHKI